MAEDAPENSQPDPHPDPADLDAQENDTFLQDQHGRLTEDHTGPRTIFDAP